MMDILMPDSLAGNPMVVAPPPLVPPIQGLLLIVAFFLVMVLLYQLFRQKKVKTESHGKNMVFSIFVVILLIIAILGIVLYEPPRYTYQSRYWLNLTLTDSSGGFTLNDFQINGQPISSTYPGQNHTSIFDLEPDSIEHFMLYCSKTDIFWGNRSIELNLYASFHQGNSGILYYHNQSNEYTVREFGSSDHWVRTPIDLFFSNGHEWVDFQLQIKSPPLA